MSRIYVGNLNPRVTERDLEDEFRVYGVLRSVWVARKPPGYAFVEFDDRRDAMDAIRGLDGRYGWRVELSRSSGGGGGGGSRLRGDDRCYECGEAGHFARECSLRVGPGGLGSGSRRRSPSPRYWHSPSYGRRSMSPRRRSLSPPRRGRYLSPSPIRRDLSPYGRRASPYERRDEYRQPLYYDRRASPYANGSSFVGRDRQRSLSASL